VKAQVKKEGQLRNVRSHLWWDDDLSSFVVWIPFDDLPHYDALRAWLHTLADAVTAAHPTQHAA
jgi:hypothetical protein